MIDRTLKLCHLSDMLKTETSAGKALGNCLMTIINNAVVCYADRDPSRIEGLLLDVDRICSVSEILNDLQDL